MKPTFLLTVPDDIGGFRLRAQEPLGQSWVYALVSSVRLNLYTDEIGKEIGRFKGYASNEFDNVKRAMTRALAVEADDSSAAVEPFGAAVLTFEVVE